jgi:GntR family transcriptional regulator/MocR family aminotransferase
MLLMPKLDDNSEVPIYVQLYNHIKNEIVSGRIAEARRLPSVRKLADFLAISTTPVEMAYHQLLAEGFIESRPRSGYYVQKMPEAYQQLGYGDDGNPAGQTASYWYEQTYEYDFHLSKNDFSHFPFQTWRSLFNQILRVEQKEMLFYGDPQGEKGLRCQVAKYLRQFRGVTCSPEQIVIGAEQYLLLSLLCLLLKHHSAGIGLENPGYPLFRSTFRQHGFQTVPISLEEDGINIGELYDSSVRLVYVSPPTNIREA